MANTEAFYCDECGDGVILWDGMNEEILDCFEDYLNVLSVNQDIEILPGGFCYSCHLRVN